MRCIKRSMLGKFAVICALPLVRLFSELVWRLSGPRWCRMREPASLAMNPDALRKAGLL